LPSASRQSAIDDFQWFLFTGPNLGAETSGPLFPSVRFFMWFSLPAVPPIPTLEANDREAVARSCLSIAFPLVGEKSVQCVLQPGGEKLTAEGMQAIERKAKKAAERLAVASKEKRGMGNTKAMGLAPL
jgi:hypothetical protein